MAKDAGGTAFKAGMVPKRPYLSSGWGWSECPQWGGRPLCVQSRMNSSHNRGRIRGRGAGNGAWEPLSVPSPAYIGRRCCLQSGCTCVCKACLPSAHAHPALCFSYEKHQLFEQGCQDKKSTGDPAHGRGDRTGSPQGLRVVDLAGVDQAPGATCRARLGHGAWRPTGHQGWGRGQRGVRGTCGAAGGGSAAEDSSLLSIYFLPACLLPFFFFSYLRKSCNETD